MNAERITTHFEVATNIGLYGASLAFRSGMARGIARQEMQAAAFNSARAAAIRSNTKRKIARKVAERDAEVARVLRSF